MWFPQHPAEKRNSNGKTNRTKSALKMKCQMVIQINTKLHNFSFRYLFE